MVEKIVSDQGHSEISSYLAKLGYNPKKIMPPKPIKKAVVPSKKTIVEDIDFSFCGKVKDCGHKCTGVKDEDECLPCLESDCIIEEGGNLNCDDGEELCSICYTCELREEPSVKLSCGHVFHANCVVKLLKHKWASLRITFAFMNCPSCKAPIKADHVDEIRNELKKLRVFRLNLQMKALKVAKDQGMDRDERVLTQGDFFYNRL